MMRQAHPPRIPGTPKALLLALLLAGSVAAQAAVPERLSYQGYLATTGGTPVTSATNLTFRLYAVASGGTALWSETQSVTPADGVYGVELGSVSTLAGVDLSGGELYLGVQVGADAEMTPRMQFASVAYTLRAAVAENAATATTANAANALAGNGTNCPAGQYAKGVDAAGNAEGCVAVGTVTSVTASAPLSSSTGTTPHLSLNGCAVNQILKHNGSAWACAADADTNSGGTVTGITAGAGLSGGTINTSGTIAVDPASATLTSNFHKQGGNNYGVTAVLGTSDNQAVDIRVNGSRVMRFEPHATSPKVVGGNPSNTASGEGSIVAGGGSITGPNTASGNYSAVAGGISNTASDFASTVAGGWANSASGNASAIAGGVSNTASGLRSTVAGGTSNTASGDASAVAGGTSNTASGEFSVVAGGYANTASGRASIAAGGMFNIASGDYSFAAGMSAKTETADATPVRHRGAFVWADSNGFDFRSAADNELAARATGGVRFVTAVDGMGNSTKTFSFTTLGELRVPGNDHWNLDATEGDFRVGTNSYSLKIGVAQSGGGAGSVWLRPAGGIEVLQLWAPGGTNVFSNTAQTSGVRLSAGSGTWASLSDRAAKRDLTPVDGRAVLAKVAALPLAEWSYKSEIGVRHLGPMAQDFRAAFGLGPDDKTITTVDADGVALAAIQGLAQAQGEADNRLSKAEAAQRETEARLQAKDAEIATLRKEKAAEIEALKDRLASVELLQREELAELRWGLATLRAAVADSAGTVPVGGPLARVDAIQPNL